MKNQTIAGILEIISSDKGNNFDYEGYATLDEMKLTKAELTSALKVMWDICMEMDESQRKQKYLFNNGLLKSKDNFMEQYNNPNVNIPSEKIDNFRNKLENIKPLVDFLIKIKEIL